jgi:hypothetical protein
MLNYRDAIFLLQTPERALQRQRVLVHDLCLALETEHFAIRVPTGICDALRAEL